MKNKITIISGIGPGSTGTGAFLIGLMAEAKDNGLPVRFIYKEKTPRRRGWARLQKFNPVRIFKYMFNQLSFSPRSIRAANLDDEVVLMHPQTIKFKLFKRLVEARPYTWMYVLDSFIFCRRSYNYIIGESVPCLRCVGNNGSAALGYGCLDLFNSGPYHLHFARWVNSGRLKLMVQSESQARLLRMHFGGHAVIKVAHLSVPDIDTLAPQAHSLKNRRTQVVFHGTCQPAKGVGYVIVLAQMMPDWDFIIPSTINEYVRNFGSTKSLPSNVLFMPMTWADGLSEFVAKADLVICPSAWSAPVEGAILKSLAHNGLLAVIPHDSSFASDIPPGARLDINPLNWEATVGLLRTTLSSPLKLHAIREAARNYITQYNQSNSAVLEKIISICYESGAK